MRWLWLIAAVACTPNFDAQSDVHDLRILAVQADPPEAQFSDAGVDDVRVHVLAVDPSAPTQSARMTATLCAPTDTGVCDGSGPQLTLTPETAPIGGDLSALIRLPPQVVAAALQADKLGGLGGIRVMFTLSVDDGDPHGPANAYKFLLYSPAGGTPNHNPLLAGVRLTEQGVDKGTFAPGATLPLPANTAMGLRPLLADGAREEYDTMDLKGNTVHLQEDPRYYFFTEPGATINRDTADEPFDGGAPPDGLVQITAPRAGVTGTLWIVVRDGRGGESWSSFTWNAE